MKHWKYLKYIVRHKWYVFVECCKMGIPFRGMTHDLSKLLPSEWIPYCNYFYAPKITMDQWHDNNPALLSIKHTDKYMECEFDFAWLKHQKKNKHHWQWWVLLKDSGDLTAMDMPEKYIKEMIADWRGAGRAITGKDDTKQWYLKNKDKMVLSDFTRKWVEEELNVSRQWK